MIFAKLPPRLRHSQNAAPATTFYTLSCLCSPDTAIHENSTFATSPNAAPGTKLHIAAAQSAASSPSFKIFLGYASKVCSNILRLLGQNGSQPGARYHQKCTCAWNPSFLVHAVTHDGFSSWHLRFPEGTNEFASGMYTDFAQLSRAMLV